MMFPVFVGGWDGGAPRRVAFHRLSSKPRVRVLVLPAAAVAVWAWVGAALGGANVVMVPPAAAAARMRLVAHVAAGV